ncbi:MAG: RAMP superfamily CRISPR-associated protein [Elainellaceae cyanobacterium]
MARTLNRRIRIKGTLVAQCPVHVGGISRDPEIDLALAIDGQGRYYIPGTSLAGALRAWMAAVGDETTIDFLWGTLKGKKPNGNDKQPGAKGKKPNHASFVLIEDAPITNVIPEVRDGVGIDRFLGSAANLVKYDQAILPRGSKIPLEMTVELQDNDKSDSILELLKDTLTALQNRELRLGASKTRGMGRVELQSLSISEQRLDTAKGMLQALRKQGEGLDVSTLSQSNTLQPRPRLSFTIHWTPIDALMVKAETDGIVVDHLPLVSAIDADNLAFVLPGSSIKGALRTQAERIVRTVKQIEIPDTTDPNRRFMNQLEQNSLIMNLFGRAARVERNGNGKSNQLGRIGALAVDDCYAQSAFDERAWNKIASSTTSEDLDKALKEDAKLSETQQGFHVAIDRWTGGAADGLLYSTLEPMGIDWEPMTIALDLKQLEKNQENASVAIALLLLVLRDLIAGRIPLGYATNRGMGAIAIDSIHIQGRDLPEDLSALQDVTWHSGQFNDLDANLRRSLTTAWTHWMNSSPKTAEVPA